MEHPGANVPAFLADPLSSLPGKFAKGEQAGNTQTSDEDYENATHIGQAQFTGPCAGAAFILQVPIHKLDRSFQIKLPSK